MESDYYRGEIEHVIAEGPHKDDSLRVKLLGKRDSKFLTITADQARCLADVMDETNPPTLLPLQNGHRVIKADVTIDSATRFGQGVVLADTGEGQRYVVWRVYLHKGESRWLAEGGEYSSGLRTAVKNYNARRGVTMKED